MTAKKKNPKQWLWISVIAVLIILIGGSLLEETLRSITVRMALLTN